jgi:hypothetical protein
MTWWDVMKNQQEEEAERRALLAVATEALTVQLVTEIVTNLAAGRQYKTTKGKPLATARQVLEELRTTGVVTQKSTP